MIKVWGGEESTVAGDVSSHHRRLRVPAEPVV
jgi:hypothetical protein